MTLDGSVLGAQSIALNSTGSLIVRLLVMLANAGLPG
jgi:hypothetical protein